MIRKRKNALGSWCSKVCMEYAAAVSSGRRAGWGLKRWRGSQGGQVWGHWSPLLVVLAVVAALFVVLRKVVGVIWSLLLGGIGVVVLGGLVLVVKGGWDEGSSGTMGSVVRGFHGAVSWMWDLVEGSRS